MQLSTAYFTCALFGSMLFTFSSVSATEKIANPISYNKQTDALTVKLKDASFKEAMARIATLSGIEILMDPKAEHTVTVTLNDTPLEKALKEISKQTNSVFTYAEVKPAGKDAKLKTVLTGMQILPKGEAGNQTLVPLLAPGGEAFIREKDRRAAPEKDVQIFNYAQQRWDARLKNMPPEQRDTVIANAEKKLEDIKKRKEEREQKKANNKTKAAEHDQKRQAKLEAMKTEDPERYELRMQRQAERQQGIKPQEPQ